MLTGFEDMAKVLKHLLLVVYMVGYVINRSADILRKKVENPFDRRVEFAYPHLLVYENDPDL